jgi:hypothetical protein
MDWPDDGILPCPLGQIKLILIDRERPQSSGVDSPARETVDE